MLTIGKLTFASRRFGSMRGALALCIAALLVAPLLFGGLGIAPSVADAGEVVLRQPKAASGGMGRRGDLGETQLERLPWDVHVLRADLSRDRPVAIAGFYLMKRNLIVVTQAGAIYCLDRFNLEPRWVNTLKAPLAHPPTEGPNHFVFLCKDYRGQHWVHAIAKRSGEEVERFPKRLGFAASSGVAANGTLAFMGSLGAALHNKTFESVNLLSGRGGWGYLAPGLVNGAPAVDGSGKNVIFVTDNGHVISLPAGATAPSGANWNKKVANHVRAGVALSPDGAYVGDRDGTVYCLDSDSGKVRWLQASNGDINATPWVLGSTRDIEIDTGIEGAYPIKRREFVGVVVVRNIRGLWGFDAKSGTPAFRDLNAARPVALQKDWLMTVDKQRVMTFRNAKKGYEAADDTLQLGMFDLIPTNRHDGAVYCATSDGSICAAVPR